MPLAHLRDRVLLYVRALNLPHKGPTSPSELKRTGPSSAAESMGAPRFERAPDRGVLDSKGSIASVRRSTGA